VSRDGLLFAIGAGLVLYGVWRFASGNSGTAGADGGDETAPQSVDGGGAVSGGDASSVLSLAQQTLGDMGIADVSPEMATAIAKIESGFDPGAVRQEPRINDASYGLMQVLAGTAQWLSGLGYTAVDPSPQSLLTSEGSMYFGCAYLHWLRNYKGQPRDDAFVVAAYNGGPGGAAGAGPQRYLAAWQAAMAELGFA
jgi:soluble lytic murein transglycosylase-like protein